MLTVRGLVEQMELELAVEGPAADAPVRWVHCTELDDPTRWLSGGELVLTTGIRLRTDDDQRAFVRRLHEHQLAGVGFGVGFDHERLPKALVDEARECGFPVFEVPYDVPFIAITERAFSQLVNEQYDVLQRGIATQKRLERLVLEEGGLEEVTRSLATAIGGAVMVLDSNGAQLASKAFRREFSEGALAAIRTETAQPSGNGQPPAAFSPEHAELAGRALALPVATAGSGPPQAWLVAARDSGGFGDFERLILHQAVTIVALELLRQRTMRDTERRLAGEALSEALAGRLEPDEIARKLRPFGVGDQAAAIVFRIEPRPEAGAAEAEALLDRFMQEVGVTTVLTDCDPLICAVIDASRSDPVELATRARDALAARYERVRAGASRPAPAGVIRRSFHEARCALEASELADGSGPDVASHRDLGAFRLLLSLQDDDALRAYCDGVLGPLEDGEGDYGGELLRSLEAFIEQNGQWERAARELFCHRHTLRYRIRRIEELTGRDLSNARDRIEFWLALRGRDLVA